MKLPEKFMRKIEIFRQKNKFRREKFMKKIEIFKQRKKFRRTIEITPKIQEKKTFQARIFFRRINIFLEIFENTKHFQGKI